MKTALPDKTEKQRILEIKAEYKTSFYLNKKKGWWIFNKISQPYILLKKLKRV